MEEKCQEHKERKDKKTPFFCSCVCVWLVDSNNFGRVSHHTSPSIYYPAGLFYIIHTQHFLVYSSSSDSGVFFFEIVSFPLSPHTLGCITSNQLTPLYYTYYPFKFFCFFSGIFIERARRSCLGYNCDGNIHSSLSPTHSPRPWRGYSENIYQILYESPASFFFWVISSVRSIRTHRLIFTDTPILIFYTQQPTLFLSFRGFLLLLPPCAGHPASPAREKKIFFREFERILFSMDDDG
jgi:hypothetical protein